jgi:hypothetical protein
MRPFAHFDLTCNLERLATSSEQARRNCAQDPSTVIAGAMRCFRAGLFVLLPWCLAACTREADKDLWHREFASSRPVKSSEVAGYWQGDIAMGAVRAKIESGRFTLAIRCDSDGKLVAQGSAPVSVQSGTPSVMLLQTDLKSDSGDDVCGFRFYKGNQFAFALLPDGVLKINFAGSSVSELTKLADLENTK